MKKVFFVSYFKTLFGCGFRIYKGVFFDYISVFIGCPNVTKSATRSATVGVVDILSQCNDFLVVATEIMYTYNQTVGKWWTAS